MHSPDGALRNTTHEAHANYAPNAWDPVVSQHGLATPMTPAFTDLHAVPNFAFNIGNPLVSQPDSHTPGTSLGDHGTLTLPRSPHADDQPTETNASKTSTWSIEPRALMIECLAAVDRTFDFLLRALSK